MSTITEYMQDGGRPWSSPIIINARKCNIKQIVYAALSVLRIHIVETCMLFKNNKFHFVTSTVYLLQYYIMMSLASCFSYTFGIQSMYIYKR